MAASKSTRKWYNERIWASCLAVISVAAGVALAMRALDTGSLGQYLIVFLLFIVAINRALEALFPKRGMRA